MVPARLLLPALLACPLAGQGAAPAIPGAALLGDWVLLRVDNLKPDGTRVPLYGDHPAGLLTFLPDGTYAIQIFRADRPRFASGDKARGTEAEYRAAGQGCNAHFGRYEADPAGGTLTFRIAHASFPNWEGTVQVRPYRLEGDRLVYTVPAPTSGGAVTGEVVWRRAGSPAR